MAKYFAYGSCTNVESFANTLKDAGRQFEFSVLGVGKLEGFRLAFTRKKCDGTGALDIIESENDYVLGVVYQVPDEAVGCIDRREGAPRCYRRVNDIKVQLGDEKISVITYMVVDKHWNEVCPSDEYYRTVYEGMKSRFPIAYINRYLIDHCNRKFNKHYPLIRPNSLYHSEYSQETQFMRMNPELYHLLRQMATYLGNDNHVAETVQPTPEMFRLLVKCTELAARDELDFGHLIPRGIFNRLASEFQRISGIETERV